MAQATSPSQLRLIWGKCRTDAWCELNNVDLSSSAFSHCGVYVIWYISKEGNIKIVRVGQAETFRARLADHRDDYEIQDYARVRRSPGRSRGDRRIAATVVTSG